MVHPVLATPRSGWGGRGYRIPGRADVYPSVTTVLKQVAKPGLHQWIADQTAAKAVMNLGYLSTVQAEVAWRSLRFYWSKDPKLVGSELRLYYEGVKDDAADLGTNVHEWIEAHIDGLMPYPAADSIEMEQMIEAFAVWSETHTVISHNAEFTCVNDDIGIAGTADADWSIRCDHGGHPCLGQEPGQFVRTLVDVKSSRNLWRENGYQLAALASANTIMRQVAEGTPGAVRAEKTERGKKIRTWWVEEPPPVWERYALLHIRPDDLDAQGNDIPAFCLLADRTEDMDLFYEGFVGALGLARSEFKLKQRAKARGIEIEEEVI